MDNNQFDLSVIVICKNEENYIEECLKSLQMLKSMYKTEIILVDSNSTDRTVEKALSSGVLDKAIIVNYSNYYSASLGRKIGTEYIQGKYVFFIDGDMEVDVQTFKKCYEYLAFSEDEHIAGIVGERTDYFYSKLELFSITEKYFNYDHFKKVRMFGGAVLLKKSVLNEVGTFNPSLVSNEEEELYLRIINKKKYVVGIQDTLVIHHTPYLCILDKIKMLFNKKNLSGFGQALKASQEYGILGIFVIHHHALIVSLIIDIITLLLLIIQEPILLMFINIFFLQGISIIYHYLSYEHRYWYYILNKIRYISIIYGTIHYQKQIMYCTNEISIDG